MQEESNQFQQAYSEGRLWSKIKRFSLAAGKDVIEKALVLYYTLGEPGVPVWARTVITVALGYFIFPTDAILDITPAVGYADDLGVLLAALATVAAHVTPAARQRADETMKSLFGDRTAEPDAE